NFGGENHGNSGVATVVGIDLKQEIGFLGNPKIIGAKSWAGAGKELAKDQRRSLVSVNCVVTCFTVKFLRLVSFEAIIL
ncbi:hypothetical protein U1Q18_024807, partial [Sarracenia purpurea var. burkii]